MKKKVQKKQLILSTEKVRKLSDTQIDDVAGGWSPTSLNSLPKSTCPACVSQFG